MKKISSFEYNSMIWFIIRGGYIGLTLSNLILVCEQDSWFSAIIATVLGFIPLFIFNYLKNFDSSMSITELNIFTLGKFGKFINFLLAIGGLIFCLILFVDLTNFIYSQFLFKTNTLFISICFIIPLLYILFKGINAISKTSLLLFYLVIFTIIFIITGLFSGLDINNLQPFLRHSAFQMFHGSFIMIAYNVLPLVFLLCIPKNKISNDDGKKSLIFYLLAMLSLANAAFLTIGVLGVPLSTLFKYPEFHLLKKLQMGEFINRLESILSLEWVVALFLLLCIGMFFVNDLMKKNFNLKEKNSKAVIIFSCIILLCLNGSVFENNTEIINFLQGPMIFIVFGFFFIIPFITFIACLINRFYNKDSYRGNH